MAKARAFDDDRRDRFLAMLRDGATVVRAAAAVGITVRAVYWCRERDPAFAQAWAAARRPGDRPWQLRFRSHQRRAFLDTLAETGEVGRAAAAAGVCRRTVYWHRQRDTDLGADWAMARNMALDRLEDRLFDGAFNGFRSEETVGTVTKVRVIQRPDMMFRLLGTRSAAARSGIRTIELTPELVAAARAKLERQLALVAREAAAEARAATLAQDALPPPTVTAS